MTDADTRRAERLARLGERRSAPTSAQPTSTVESTPSARGTAAADRRRGRRRSPATTAKIVTVGVSTTAVLGMMAGYGIAEQVATGKPVLIGDGQALAAPPLTEAAATIVPLATPAATVPPTVPPQVIVVVIDGATGRQISGEFDLSTLAAAPPDAASVGGPSVSGTVSAASSPSSQSSKSTPPSPAAANPQPSPAAAPAPAAAPVPAPAAAPAPVAVPVAVELAVPAAPPPPAPAPQPQATSGGS